MNASTRAAITVGALVAVVLAGCAEVGVETRASDSAHMVGMAGMKDASAHMGSTAGDSGMAGMNMSADSAKTGASATTEVTANGIKPVPIQVLGTADWQGMKITAQVMTPVPFVVYNGTGRQMVKPGKASFHLMVMLNDADTNVPIPYATVWATITRNGKVVFDERQWPMISALHGHALRRRRHPPRRRHLHAEPADQPTRLRTAPRVRERVAEAPSGHLHVPLEADLSLVVCPSAPRR